MRRMRSYMLLMLLTVGILASCVSLPTPQAQSVSEAVEFRISNGTTVQAFRPGDTGYTPIAQALATLVENLDEKARTFYDENRFEAELGVLPYLLAEYDQEVILVGRRLQARAIRLAVVCPGGDKLVLVHPADEAIWAVYLTSQVSSFDALLEAVKSETGVDLLLASSR